MFLNAVYLKLKWENDNKIYKIRERLKFQSKRKMKFLQVTSRNWILSSVTSIFSYTCKWSITNCGLVQFIYRIIFAHQKFTASSLTCDKYSYETRLDQLSCFFQMDHEFLVDVVVTHIFQLRHKLFHIYLILRRVPTKMSQTNAKNLKFNLIDALTFQALTRSIGNVKFGSCGRRKFLQIPSNSIRMLSDSWQKFTHHLNAVGNSFRETLGTIFR